MLDCSHRWRTTCVGTGTVKKRALERRWPPLLAVLSGFAAAALNGREVQVPSCSLRLLPDVKVGPASCTLGFNESASVGECCALCQKLPSCRAFTLEPAERRCYLKSCANGSTPVSPEQGTVSGAPPPAPLEPVLITAEHGVTNTVSRWFKSWNIDASPNRQWETRDLSDPLLHYLAAASEPGLLRFGGSGNDGLRYGVGQPCPSDGRCLNETHFVRFMDFAAAAGSRLVFGLNIEVRDAAGRWDSRDAKPLIEFALAHNYSFFGFELGAYTFDRLCSTIEYINKCAGVSALQEMSRIRDTSRFPKQRTSPSCISCSWSCFQRHRLVQRSLVQIYTDSIAPTLGRPTTESLTSWCSSLKIVAGLEYHCMLSPITSTLRSSST